MTGDHITEAILEAYRCGKISPEVFERRIIRHLQSECEVCYREIAKWRQSPLRGLSSFGFLHAIAEEEVPPSGDEEEAQKDLKTLLPLAFSEREGKITRALSRFRSPLLARALAQEAISELGQDLEEASNLLDLAFLILDHGRPTVLHREVKAHALAVKAILSKLAGDFDQAAQLFEQAHRLVPRNRIVDLVLAGELAEMEGEFLMDRRELGRAETLLLEASTRYSVVGDNIRQARAFLVLGLVRLYAGRFEDAIADSQQVIRLAPEHKAYGVLATHNICLALADSGRPDEAAQLLKEYQPRYKDAEGVWRTYDLHFHWLAGRISYGLGRFTQAEVHLSKAKDGFSSRGTAYDMIMVCFDLALVYDAVGRDKDLLQLTSAISGELARNSLHKESATAITLFLKAAAKKTVSDELVREIRYFLRFSRINPNLKCELSLDQLA